MRRRPVLVATALIAVGALVAATGPATASPAVSAHRQRLLSGAETGAFPGAEVPVGDRDARGPALRPLPEATAAVSSFGTGAMSTYNRWGTIGSLVRSGGWLAQGLPGAPADGARAFLKAHSGLLGLTPAEVDALRLTGDTLLPASTSAHVVSFTQQVDGLPLSEGGLVIVGIRDGKVASVTSSAVATRTLGRYTRPAAPISAARAVVAAARDAGVTTLTEGDLTLVGDQTGGFTVLRAKGVQQRQYARQRVLPTTQGARLVWETAVQDVGGGRALAVQSYVDASTGAVLLRRDAVDTIAGGLRNPAATLPAATLPAATLPAATLPAATLPAAQVPSGGVLQGSIGPGTCSDQLPISVPAGTQSIAVVVAAANPANDITVDIYRNGKSIAHGDLLTSPEAVTATVNPAAVASDTFYVQVCPYPTPTVPESAPFNFAGFYTTSDQTTALPTLPTGLIGMPDLQGPGTYKVFQNTPKLPPAANTDADQALLCDAVPGVTTTKTLTGCVFSQRDNGKFLNPATGTGGGASPYPYDVDPVTGLPTFATIGNNAVTTNAQASTSLTPGAPATPFAAPGTRDYRPGFTDAWRASNCDPLQGVGQADVNAAVTNLFIGHNRIHDFAYRLGLTEARGALQTSNFGLQSSNPDVKELDPELGNAQNAALTNSVFPITNQGTVPTTGIGLAGRNNANQITLMDGVPGITNQYLFEPVLGFYGPCADGDLDASIFLHEYTHAISNRLVAGPATGLSGQQGGSMGESWGDLVAIEYLQAFGIAGKQGEDPFSVGAYATGNPAKGIRDYNLDPARNPLNYAEFGFDAVGPEVHADGEIWNGIQMAVRQALIDKYDRLGASAADAALQRSCALGQTSTGAPRSTFDGCPGNRRWVQYLFDGMILQASGTPSFVDIKNTMLAGDTMRGGTDQQVLADAFAARGLGVASKSNGSDDTDPTPSFASPTAARNATVTFDLTDAATGAKVPGQVFAGTYSARALPVATTLGGKSPAPTASFVAGTYSFVVQAAGYGLQRFTATFAPGATTQRFALDRNVASTASGATVTGDGGVRLDAVIDDSEATDGGFDGSAASTPVAGRSLTVALGGYKKVSRIAVSALHRPLDSKVSGDFQGRLLGVRAFDLQASTDGGKTFTTVYRSPDDFFPAARPRPTAPDINLRSVTLPQPVVADTLRMVIRSNQCTGGPDFNGAQKSAAAIALNGDSACAYTKGVPAAAPVSSAGSAAAAPDTTNPQAFQVTVTEFEAFGVPTAAPAGVQNGTPAPAGAGGSLGAGTATRGRALAATGASAAVGALALLLLVGSGIALRAARRRQP